MIPLKSENDLRLMRISGRILAKVMGELQKRVKANVSTLELDSFAEELILKEKALPAFKDYRGFPASICASINEEIVHGIPSERRLKEGDILSLDLGVKYQGFFSDAAVTVAVGKIDSKVKKLIDVAKNALSEGIKQARVGNHVSDISCAIQSYVERNGCSVVRQFVGHGIGKNLHEEPEIPNYGLPHRGEVIKSGMVFAIETMVNLGTWECEIADNGWTAVTKDGFCSAHFEHTVAVSNDGVEILTLL